MKYDTRYQVEYEAAFEYLTRLGNKGTLVEVKKVSKARSLNQNNYLHLLLSAWGAHFGYTLEESKLIYKELNKDIYGYEKKGRAFYKSSSELDTTQMTITIDRFRAWSDKHDYYLPSPDEETHLRSLQNTIEQVQTYL